MYMKMSSNSQKNYIRKKILFKNGDKYEGEIKICDIQDNLYKKRMITGFGKYIFHNGNVYDGEFKDGKRHGKGKVTFHSGALYEGYFKDDKKHGKGIYTNPNGHLYFGYFKDDLRHGKGEYILPNGNIYRGDFKDDLRHGKGLYTLQDNSILMGNTIKNKREGLFEMILDKRFYELKDGKMKKILVSNNIKGTGYFKNNKIIYETLYHPTNNSKLCREYHYEKDKVIHKITMFSNDGRQFSKFHWVGQKKLMDYEEKEKNLMVLKKENYLNYKIN
jgi:hypothetical protein